jgi:hypothetical protein
MKPRTKCPHCGNTDERSIEDNGRKSTDSLYTLLCMARVALGEDAFGGGGEPGEDGKVACGMQWEPNS